MSVQGSDVILIDALSGKFAHAWKSGQRPQLEDYLDGAPPAVKPALLGELLSIELDHRQRLQETVAKDEYLRRFAQFDSVITDSFAKKFPRGVPSESSFNDGFDPPLTHLGPYELLEPLSHGGMGAVYKAKHGRLKKIVALKVIHAGKQTPKGLARFQQEMEVIGRLNHPNIVQATDAGEDAGIHYLVMEFVHGVTLLKLAKLHHVLPLDSSCYIARQAAAGLAHIHKHDLVHRDMKPANVMVTVSGQVKILDLGLARLNDESLTQDHLTQEGHILGSLDYMAPEQFETPHGVDIRADIYGLGCTLFHLLTGRPPYFDANSSAVVKKLMAHARAPIPSVRDWRPELPEGIDRVVTRMLAKHPGDRYQSPADLIGALEEFIPPTSASACRQLAIGAYQLGSSETTDFAFIDLTEDGAHTTEASAEPAAPRLELQPLDEPALPCPYPGLRAFARDESHLFFGREEHLELLLDKLARHRFLAVVGPSGCGKSSLVTAGLMPMFASGFIPDAGPHWREAVMRPGEAPFERLAQCLLDERALGPERGSGPHAAGALEATLRRGVWGLVDALNETGLPDGSNLVLLVDQFEEIFRYREICQSESRFGANDAQAFVDLLLAATKASAESEGRSSAVKVYVIITMRWDFLDDHFHFSGLTDALNRSVFFTPRLTRDQVRAAIVGPARSFNSDIEPVLVNRLLNDTATDPDQLPLIQHTLMRMWLHEARQRGLTEPAQDLPKLTLAGYERIGNAGQALSQHADEKLESCTPRQQQIVRKMFQWLCERTSGKRDTRRPITLGEIAKVAAAAPAEVIRVAEQFRTRDCCLLMPPLGVPLEEDTILDISHECLIRKWRRLQGWLEEEAEAAALYDHLLSAARQWLREERLWPFAELDRALAWHESAQPNETWALRYGGDFALVERFLEASKELRNRGDAALRRENEYDVFLCYHPDDRSAVRAIAERLQAASLRPWFDEWDLPPGRSWQDELSQRLDQIGAAAVFVGPGSRAKSQEMSLRGLVSAFVDRERPVIPVLLAGAEDELPTFLRGPSAVDFRRDHPDPLKQLVWGITGKRPG